MQCSKEKLAYLRQASVTLLLLLVALVVALIVALVVALVVVALIVALVVAAAILLLLLLCGWHHWHRLFLWLMDNDVVRQLHLWSHLAWHGPKSAHLRIPETLLSEENEDGTH